MSLDRKETWYLIFWECGTAHAAKQTTASARWSWRVRFVLTCCEFAAKAPVDGQLHDEFRKLWTSFAREANHGGCKLTSDRSLFICRQHHASSRKWQTEEQSSCIGLVFLLISFSVETKPGHDWASTIWTREFPWTATKHFMLLIFNGEALSELEMTRETHPLLSRLHSHSMDFCSGQEHDEKPSSCFHWTL